MKKGYVRIILLVVFVLVIIVSFFIYEKAVAPKENFSNLSGPTELCFYREFKTQNNLLDRSWVHLNIEDSIVRGDFNNYPAEKDSKTGFFEGSVEQKSDGKYLVSSIWNAFAEGAFAQEELLIEFDSRIAEVGFGEMIDSGNEVYSYKNKSEISFSLPMDKIKCDALDKKLIEEQSSKDENI